MKVCIPSSSADTSQLGLPCFSEPRASLSKFTVEVTVENRSIGSETDYEPMLTILTAIVYKRFSMISY